ncbi:Uncharacterised protein [Mycobacteroides abscessus subsp. massiliense]|nr:Uncharacterised protein [Mycobacteroides abscessus subsp. massiliense]SKM97042.1 Uncharacterised protein [Mycobacteroides abscessus subsp. massiliense]SKN75979.1 Uncharacterised protein [Mycobacteroides abscessus subsp. massiliense]SKN97279.1 Uncharacterised protein [Mycobacteroides abscessus subsp. massiliense]SKO20619.1 Uncharacterised protein [Mycobacteroides abscessus subsp. massiliense]
MRSTLGWFWALLDSKSVRLYQCVMYTAFCCWGWYALFYDEPPSPIEPVLGEFFYQCWIWINIMCPGIVLIGCQLRGKLRYSGLWLQLGGDVGQWFGLASVVTAYWYVGLGGSFSAAVGAGLSVCVAFLVLRSARELARVEREAHRQ